MLPKQLQAWIPSPPGATPAERAAYWRIRWAVGILVVGIIASGRGQSSWPILQWTIYSQRSYSIPAHTTTTLELRAITQNGRTAVFPPHKLYPMPYGQHLAPRLMARAFEEPDTARQLATRQYLIRLVSSRLPAEEIVQIEGWRREWSVTPLAVPPVDPVAPSREHCLGTLEVASGSLTKDGPP
ncbi:MAG: hypothetical protein SFU86_06180 [Pirellulaceae bacterium]|nr:hypothetical protein [Pirellulaceae bacterium]